jgi:hypothetical protein
MNSETGRCNDRFEAGMSMAAPGRTRTQLLGPLGVGCLLQDFQGFTDLFGELPRRNAFSDLFVARQNRCPMISAESPQPGCHSTTFRDRGALSQIIAAPCIAAAPNSTTNHASGIKCIMIRGFGGNVSDVAKRWFVICGPPT